MVRRWKFTDTYGDRGSWTVPQNPNRMSSPFPRRNVTGGTTTAVDGQVILFEGNTEPAQWEFGGSIRSKEHYEGLREWVYGLRRRITITDHFGRDIECVLQQFDPVPKRSVAVYWRHDYMIRAVVTKVSAPTAGEDGS